MRPAHTALALCFSLAAAAATAATLAGCAVQEPGEPPPGGDVDAGGGTDAGGGSGSGSGSGSACEQPASTLPNGMHNAGLACLGCHNGTGVAPKWSVAGTLYSTAQGGAAIAGATITVTDANNVTVKLVTASNGNFYTSQTLQMPLRVNASRCPSSRTMSARPATGDCNSCHQAATTGRIHLP
jgi:hypothetical protein